MKSPCCLRRPGNPIIPGFRSRPTRKNAIVAVTSENARKWTEMYNSARRMMPAAERVDAMPQARPVISMKKERRYVNDGSGRCHVFFVSRVRRQKTQ